MNRVGIRIAGLLALTAFAAPAAGHATPYPQASLTPYHVVLDVSDVTNDPFTIAITDNATSPVGGRVCQDWNADAICGGVGEPNIAFCGYVAVSFAVDLDPAVDVHVIVDNAATILPACGLLAIGTTGTVNHS